MDSRLNDLTSLVDEYQTLAAEISESSAEDAEEFDLEKARGWLVVNGEWTPRGATELVQLVDNYGAFMLRNAAALAIALDIDDGRLGL